MNTQNAEWAPRGHLYICANCQSVYSGVHGNQVKINRALRDKNEDTKVNKVSKEYTEHKKEPGEKSVVQNQNLLVADLRE